LDEAERCDQVIVMHRGKALATGSPEDVSRLAAGRAFLADPPAGRKAREFQARLLDRADIVDAVPAGGEVRFVGAEATGAEVRPAAPRFEDGFMILLHRTGAPRESMGAMTLTTALEHAPNGAAVEVRDLVRQFGSLLA